jgi:DNA-binding Lrp family transcriptional regulator
MAKLYTVKEIAELMSNEFGNNPADYKFTEERVRARIRAAREKGLIKPIRMGYDRRTRYYSQEDVDILKATWIGPELPEFTEYREDIETSEDNEIVDIRAAKIQDAEAIISLFDIGQEEKVILEPYLDKMLKSKQVANFVATINENVIIGWAEVEISSALSLIKRKPYGLVRLNVLDLEERIIVARSLAFRAQQWLNTLSVYHFTLEIPESMTNLQTMFEEKLGLKPEISILELAK